MKNSLSGGLLPELNGQKDTRLDEEGAEQGLG